MTASREHFSSRLGFILAAAGSAVGIGNLVGFPSKCRQKWWWCIFISICAICYFHLLTCDDCRNGRWSKNAKRTRWGL